MSKPQEHKTLPSFVTKLDGDLGIVEHTVAVMGNIDLGGDRIHLGAFTKTITERAGQIRVLDAHNSGKVADVLGKPLALWEVGRDQLGPEIKAQFPDATGALMARTQFLMDTPEGRGAFVRIRDGAVDQYSIGYDALDVDFTEEQKDDDGPAETVRNLRTIRLWEYSPVAFAMNPATETVRAKEAESLSTAKQAIPIAVPATWIEDDMLQLTPEKLAEWIKAATEDERADLWQAYVMREGKRALDDDSIALPREKSDEPATPQKEIDEGGRPTRRVGDLLTGSIHRAFSVIADDLIINGFLTQDQRILMSAAIGDALDALNAKIPAEIMDIKLDGDGIWFCMGAASPLFGECCARDFNPRAFDC